MFEISFKSGMINFHRRHDQLSVFIQFDFQRLILPIWMFAHFLPVHIISHHGGRHCRFLHHFLGVGQGVRGQFQPTQHSGDFRHPFVRIQARIG